MKSSLSRKDNHRVSLVRNLVTSLILYEEIKTTKSKAKEVRKAAEKLINLAKNPSHNLSSRRRLLAYLLDEKAVSKVFEVLIQRYKDAKSGFIYIYKLGPRLGDSAEIVVVKLKSAKQEPGLDKDKDVESTKTEGSEAPKRASKKASPKSKSKA